MNSPFYPVLIHIFHRRTPDHLLEKSAESVKNIPTRQVITSFAGLRAHEDGDDFVIGETENDFIDCAGIESPGLSSAKNDPSMHQYHRQRINPAEHFGHTLQNFSQKQFFQNQEKRKPQPPEQEVPSRTVPDTGQHPYHQNIKQLSRQALAIATQRNIHILLEPGT